MDSAAIPGMRFLPQTPKGRRRLFVGVLAALAVIFAVSFTLDEPIRRRLEAQMNASLVGYTAHVRAVRFHPFGFAITLKDTKIVQDKHPKPPVADLPRLDASVQWLALLSLRLVADVRFDRPNIHVDRTHVVAEANDDVAIEDRGWQQALEAIYPLKINEFVVRRGEITYIDDAKSPPLHVDQINFRANNIRNIRSADRTYPSDVQMTARIFESGRVKLDGNADFLAEPYAGVKGALTLADLRLDPFKPILERYNLTIAKGRLSLASNVEYSPKIKTADVTNVTLNDLDAAYINRPAHAEAAEQLRAKTAEAAKEVANDPGILLLVRKMDAERARVRFVNEVADPDYTLALDDASLHLANLSNHENRPPTTGEIAGRFMGSGPTRATFSFRPETKGPNFEVAVQIENTDLVTMNDLFRAYGDFDVAAGRFSLYSELNIHDQRIDGYLEALLRRHQGLRPPPGRPQGRVPSDVRGLGGRSRETPRESAARSGGDEGHHLRTDGQSAAEHAAGGATADPERVLPRHPPRIRGAGARQRLTLSLRRVRRRSGDAASPSAACRANDS